MDVQNIFGAGAATGRENRPADLRAAKAAAGRGGIAANPVDPARVKASMAASRSLL